MYQYAYFVRNNIAGDDLNDELFCRIDFIHYRFYYYFENEVSIKYQKKSQKKNQKNSRIQLLIMNVSFYMNAKKV